MAFLQCADGQGLIRDRFPQEVVRNQNEVQKLEEMDDSMVKPLKFDRLFDWVIVTSAVPSIDRTRAMQCVLKPSPHVFAETNSLQRLTIRVYGFLGKHNLTPTGNWNRTLRGAPKAIMYLELEPGAYPDEYADQRGQLEELRHLAYKYIGQGMLERTEKHKKLFFQRRVLRKSTGVPPWVPLEPAELFDNDLIAISSKWRLDTPAVFGRRSSSGSLRACSPLVFSAGDFVDVTAVLDIVTITKNGNNKSRVHFGFTSIIQLCAANRVEEMMKGVTTTDIQVRQVRLHESGVVLEEDGGESCDERVATDMVISTQ